MNNLKNLEAVEVSLVSKPANLKKFLIFKSKEGTEMDEILKAILESELEDENSVDEVLKAGKMSDKAQGAIKGALRLLNAYKDELPSNVMETLSKLSGYGYPAPTEKAKNKENGYKMPTEKAKKKDTLCKKSDGSLDLEGVPEDVKPVLSALWKEHQDAIKKAEDLEIALKAEKDQRLTKDYISKALELDNLNIKADEFGIVLKGLSEKAPDELDKVMEILKSANEAVKQSEIFKEVGSNGVTVNSAWAKIENMAKSIVQKDSGMTQAQAITKVMEDNPQLYNEYLQEGVK